METWNHARNDCVRPHVWLKKFFPHKIKTVDNFIERSGFSQGGRGFRSLRTRSAFPQHLICTVVKIDVAVSSTDAQFCMLSE